MSAISARDPFDSMGTFELEPGVIDPLAAVGSAYKKVEQSQREMQLAQQAAAAAKAAENAKAPATGGVDVGDASAADEENARFKAEVEKMVREELAKEKLKKLETPVSGLSIKEMLSSLNLDQYLPAFESEGMEMSVLIQLSQTEDGKAAVDEALKEIGVKSVGHRLKIFAAIQGA